MLSRLRCSTKCLADVFPNTDIWLLPRSCPHNTRSLPCRHQADTMVLQRAGRLADGEGGVDIDLLCNM
jgi:hypothetical protein